MRLKEYIVILALIGFFAYLPSLFGNFIWDDEDFVYANTYVQNFQLDKFWSENAIAGRGKISNYYRPIQFTVYAVIYKFAGANPFAFHAAGIGLHIITAIMVITVITVITNSTTVGFLTALFFLIHPVQTESVSYISGMSDQIYTLFFFLSLYMFLKRNERRLYKVLSIVFFVLSLLSKELALVLPGIIILLVISRFRFGTEKSSPDVSGRKHASLDFSVAKLLRNDIVLIGLFVFIALFYLISRFTFLKFSDIAQNWAGNPYGEHLTIRIATFFRTFFTSLGLLVFPKDLYMERDFTTPIQTTLMNPWTVLFIISNLVIICFLWIKQHKNAFIVYIGFLITLTPYVGFFLLNGVYYEHYLYLPMIFFWASVFSILCKYLRLLKFLKILLFITIVLFLTRSYVRQFDWINNERFYRQTLIRAPKSVRMLNGLGITLAEKGQCNEAISFYKQAITLEPRTPNMYHNIANCYVYMNDQQNAIMYYKKALEVNPNFKYSETALRKLLPLK